MGQPAARLTDVHVCPMFDGPKPHIGGPITGPGVPSVQVGSLIAATFSDLCSCASAPATIVKGSTGVFVSNLPAARMLDPTAHGGMVMAGLPTVLIGEVNAALLTPPNLLIILGVINQSNSVINCGYIIDSAIALLRGNGPLIAPAVGPRLFSDINAHHGTNIDFSSPTTINAVFAQLQASGPGTAQIIGIDYGAGGTGHVVVAMNVNGQVGIMEGQNWGPGQGRAFITNPAVANARYNSGGTTTFAASPLP